MAIRNQAAHSTNHKNERKQDLYLQPYHFDLPIFYVGFFDLHE